MWSMLSAFFIGRAVGGWRYIRIALLVILIACIIVGVLYAAVVFNAVHNASETRHVQHHSAR